MSLRALLVAAASAILCCARLVAQPCTPQFFGGFPALDGSVRCMAIYDDGTGPALFIGGSFTTAASGNDLPVSRIAKWTGSAWQSVSGGVNGTVYCMQVWDDGLGSGPGLYVGGVFDRAGEESVKSIARFDATGWHDVGGGVEYGNFNGQSGDRPDVRAMTLFDEGVGPSLFVAGDFDLAGGVRCWSIARWNGQSWSVVGPDRPIGYTGNEFKPIRSLVVYPNGQTLALVACGSFYRLPVGPSLGTPGVAFWNGIEWTGLPAPVFPQPRLNFNWPPSQGIDPGGIYDAAVSLDGGELTLFIGGRFRFENTGGSNAPRIAKYRPSLVFPQSVSAPLSDNSSSSSAVEVIATTTANGAPAIMLGGSHQERSLVLIDSAGGVTMLGFCDGPVYAMNLLDGPVIPGAYVAGSFTQAGGVVASRLARYGCAGSAAPASFALIQPLDNALAQTLAPTFQWTPPGSASPVYYAVRVYLDAAQTQLAYAQNNIVGTSFTPPPLTLSPGVRYWWSVSASNINGSTPSSSPFTFATRAIGDCDGNGLVNFIDLNAVLSSFGQAP